MASPATREHPQRPAPLAADQEKLRISLDGRLIGMRTTRYSWWVHWRELADYILPRRYKWLITPNEMKRGSIINQKIIDSTGTTAARTCAAGMMSGLTSPTRPWFKLGIEGFNVADDSSAVSLWLAECERRMMRVYQESNFYNSIATVYGDIGTFGTAAMLMYEDYENVIQCYNPALGEYYLDVNDKLEVDVFYREFVLTAAQCVNKFGYNNCSEPIQRNWDNGGASLTREIKICHGIEPNHGAVPKHFKFMEAYWEWGSTNKSLLALRGFFESPAMCPRWDVVANDAYGRSPGMDALGDIKQLQQETKRKAQAIDKMVNPPMKADVQMKNQPASLLPGGITYVNMANGREGFAPVYTVMPPIQEMKEDIKEVQERVKQTFFNDLFMMISQLQTVRSATEIDARREEKLVLLGPVLERLMRECLDPVVTRTFNIMSRGGLLPPAPEEIHGQEIEISYISMLAEAQRAVATSGMERLLQQAGNIAGVDPTVLDNIDLDEYIDTYGTLIRVDPKIIRDKKAVAALRQQRAEQQQQQAALAQTDAAVKGAKTLSETQVGGGQNALQSMMGGQGGAG